MKVGIVGAGNVGATIAYTLSLGDQASEIILVDKNVDKAHGEILDLRHGLPYIPYVNLQWGDSTVLSAVDVVVVTAGIARKSQQSRLDLAKTNVEVFEQIIPEYARQNPDAIYLIVSNPVDILTYAAIKYSGLPASQVVGSGNVLDSARFRSMLGYHFKVDPANVHAYILGEHGEHCVPVWSRAFIGNTPLTNIRGYDQKEMVEIFERSRSISRQIINLKGATYYAVSVGVSKIVEAIALDQNRVLPVSTLLKDYQGVSDVCLSAPTVIDKNGVDRVLEIPLDEQEGEKFKQAAEKIGTVLDDLDLRG